MARNADAGLGPEAAVAVIGAGTMGRGIAQLALAAGHPVLLHDADGQRAVDGLSEICERLRDRVKRQRMTSAQCEERLSRLTVVLNRAALAPARLAIEAVVEDLDVKHAVFAELEPVLSADCLLASNTSSLSLSAVAAALSDPSRLVGLHFFNPAPVMRLVEVVSAEQTDPDAVERATATVTAWGRTPVRCTDSPGFVVNRVARPFYAEALLAHRDAVADPAVLDTVLTGCAGFPLGPFALTDLIGQDVNEAVTHSLWQAFGYDARFTPSAEQRALVVAGRLGRKAGRGWFDYREGTTPPDPEGEPPGTPPREVTAYGAADPLLESLLERVVASPTCTLRRAHGPGPARLRLDDGTRLGLCDGRPATRPAPGACPDAASASPVTDAASGPDDAVDVLFDLALDYGTATRMALAVSERAPETARRSAAGFFQELGYTTHVVRDSPGMVVTRTVAMLVNLAADVVSQHVATAEDVDTAMRLGANHPRGPMEWCAALGPARVVALLDRLHTAWPTGRYAPSPWLRRRAETVRESAGRGGDEPATAEPTPAEPGGVRACGAEAGDAASDDAAAGDGPQRRAQRAAEAMYQADTASQQLGITLDEVAPGRAVARMSVTARMTNGHEIAHGGYLFLLADTAFAFACNSHGPAAVARSADVVFVRPAHVGDELLATAVERVTFGRSGVCDVTVVRAANGAVVAEFRGTSALVRAEPAPDRRS